MARRGKRLTRKLKKTARKTRRASRASRSRRGGVDPVSKEKHDAYLEAKRKYEEAQKELQRVNATGTNEEYQAANRALNKRYQEMWDAESVAFPKPKKYTPTVFDTRY
jgi:hypothetical protein